MRIAVLAQRARAALFADARAIVPAIESMSQERRVANPDFRRPGVLRCPTFVASAGFRKLAHTSIETGVATALARAQICVQDLTMATARRIQHIAMHTGPATVATPATPIPVDSAMARALHLVRKLAVFNPGVPVLAQALALFARGAP